MLPSLGAFTFLHLNGYNLPLGIFSYILSFFPTAYYLSYPNSCSQKRKGVTQDLYITSCINQRKRNYFSQLQSWHFWNCRSQITVNINAKKRHLNHKVVTQKSDQIALQGMLALSMEKHFLEKIEDFLKHKICCIIKNIFSNTFICILAKQIKYYLNLYIPIFF